MKQKAEVLRVVKPGYVEVRVRRMSACASAHNCGSCDHCSMMENAPEIVVVAEDSVGAQPGDTVTVETATSSVLGAAVLLYLVPFALFFLGYVIGGALGWSEGPAIVLGGGGFLLGLLGAYALDRYRRKNQIIFRVTAFGGV
ncbi:MAG: SoxR reducing system RseC family protein [Clostridiales bacterium]|nr:SoxR reducing system RseC family protein [Clostridiales bacterium]